MLISLIVPCYNEQEALPLFYDEVTKVVSQMDCDYELLLVNDGSRDSTMQTIKLLAEKDKHVKYFSFSRNFGKESAMYAGFCNAQGDCVAVMDADMQDPPSLLPEMLKILETGEYDSVATKRKTRTGEAALKSWFARRFCEIINSVSGTEIVSGARDFRLMKREMKDAILAMAENNRFSKGIFDWVGFRTYWIAFDNVERVAGVTKWSFWKLFRYGIDGIVNFSQMPLSIPMWCGVGMCFISLVLFILSLVFSESLGSPAVWIAALISTVIFVGGGQLLFLGILGQYVANIFTEVKARPHFIISETNVCGIDKVK